MKYSFFTSKEIKPSGWLRRQLEIQAKGLSGNLDKVWPDVRDSAWIGGESESWERVPYWLDGFIPLAYLLEDEDMTARAKRYIDAIIATQREDGWICPCADEEREKYDNWAVQLFTKTLTVYYECSGDERIPNVVYRVLRNYYELLKAEKIHLFSWGKYRWFEAFVAIRFIYEKYPEEWLLELAKILKEQGVDYEDMTELWKRPLNKWTFDTHIVNLTMMLKEEAVTADFLGTEYTDKAERLREVLKKHNGTPVEIFTGDECLSGLSPIQGTELCSVVEQMYSYEWLYAYTGDRKWAERLEVLAFNALPAAISDDMWTHQYDQMSNQIACVAFPGRSLFRTNRPDANRFGLEPHYGCCTANFNQGWPKLALSTFMRDGDGIVSVLPIPSVLTLPDIRIELVGDYPFKNGYEYKIEAKREFNFKARIPSFAKGLTVNGVPHEGDIDVSIGVGTSAIKIAFDVEAELAKRPHELYTFKRGSLVFSLPIKYKKVMYEYEKAGVERKFPYCDYEYLPKSDWNYAYAADNATVCEEEVDAIPFSSENPPLTLSASAVKINWGLEDGFELVCSKLPEERIALGEVEAVKLIPYGCAKLRMTEIPLIK